VRLVLKVVVQNGREFIEKSYYTQQEMTDFPA
jgi:hypothetical protein